VTDRASPGGTADVLTHTLKSRFSKARNGAAEQAAEKIFPAPQFPSAAEAATDFAALTARLKPRPFKASIESDFFSSL
jgi:hypothetical protein